jgi:hypothetical protein
MFLVQSVIYKKRRDLYAVIYTDNFLLLFYAYIYIFCSAVGASAV